MNASPTEDRKSLSESIKDLGKHPSPVPSILAEETSDTGNKKKDTVDTAESKEGVNDKTGDVDEKYLSDFYSSSSLNSSEKVDVKPPPLGAADQVSNNKADGAEYTGRDRVSSVEPAANKEAEKNETKERDETVVKIQAVRASTTEQEVVDGISRKRSDAASENRSEKSDHVPESTVSAVGANAYYNEDGTNSTRSVERLLRSAPGYPDGMGVSSKRRRKAAEIERRKRNESAFQAWLAKKDAQIAKERKLRRPVNVLTSHDRLEKVEQCEYAYQAWLNKKSREIYEKRKIEHDAKTAQNPDYRTLQKAQSAAAFRKWCQQKQVQKHKERMLEIRKSKEEEALAQRINPSLAQQSYMRYLICCVLLIICSGMSEMAIYYSGIIKVAE